MRVKHFIISLCLSYTCSAQYAVHIPRADATSSGVTTGLQTVLERSQVLAGRTNSTVRPVSNGNGAKITTRLISPLGGRPTAIRVNVKSNFDFVGARFQGHSDETFYGVWEYPWSDKLDDNGVMFDLKGVGNSDGVNWVGNSLVQTRAGSVC